MVRKKATAILDESVQSVRSLLADYEAVHPDSKGSTYRYSPYSIKLRIIDPRFRGLDLVERDNLVRKGWLSRLPLEVLNQITIVLLLTKEEKKTSPANVEFDHPIPLDL